VLLSTHIVEDVRELCPSMAVLAGGRIVLSGAPEALIAELAGRVWRKTVARDAVDAYRASRTVLSTRLSAGRTQVQVLADARPEEGFEQVAPDLEDVYFSVLAGRRAA
jgi:ABC-type multidrug transport system ATPase subunit